MESNNTSSSKDTYFEHGGKKYLIFDDALLTPEEVVKIHEVLKKKYPTS